MNKKTLLSHLFLANTNKLIRLSNPNATVRSFSTIKKGLKPPTSSKMPELATPSNHRRDLSAADMIHAKKLLEKKTSYIIDCDGVLYHSDKVLPGAREFVWWLHSTGKKYIFLTNSSDKTPKEMREKFLRLGFETVKEEHFYTSAMSTATFIAAQKPGKNIF